MPKLYEYLGLILFFYSNEHEPIHVHARYGEYEGKIEFMIENGMVIGLKYSHIDGKKPLALKQRRLFLKLAKVLSDEIVQQWINYFVLHKKIIFKKVVGKL